MPGLDTGGEELVVEASAVVHHLEERGPVVEPQGDLRRRGLCVVDDVAQPLLGAPVEQPGGSVGYPVELLGTERLAGTPRSRARSVRSRRADSRPSSRRFGG